MANHGATAEAAKEILEQGLQPMKRLWFISHQPKDIAKQVAERRTINPVILVVNCNEARKADMKSLITNLKLKKPLKRC